MAVNVALKPKHALLNPEFEGYKLSLDPLPTYILPLNSDLAKASLDDSQYSLQHYKIFALHNHLHWDPWTEDTLYYVTSTREVVQVKFQDLRFQEPQVVHNVPFDRHECGDYNVSLYFASSQLVLLADGKGTLQLLLTEDRAGTSTWKTVFSSTIEDSQKPFVVVHGMVSSVNEVNAILVSVDDKKNIKGLEEEITPFATIVTWITLAPDAAARNSWCIRRIRKLAGIGDVEYTAVNARTNSVMVASTHPWSFIHDSCKPVTKSSDKVDAEKKDKQDPLYAWTQSLEDVTVVFKLTDGVTKDEVAVKLTPLQFDVSLRDGSLSLKGQLSAKIDVQSSTWSIYGNKLEITLFKQEANFLWKDVLVGDDRGQELHDIGLLEEMHQRLAHLTSEVVQSPGKPAFNPDQLEECDDYPSDFFTLTHLDGDVHKPTQQVNLSGHQWLFSTLLTPGDLPAFCVRHDVDGVVWQPLDNCAMSHELTFHAFGYVQASKQERKFTTCSPDGSYAVICDVRKHVYVYRQPSAIPSDLRNRRTGCKVGAVARQHLVGLETQNDVIGLQATRKNLFVLTSDQLYAIRVHTE